MKTALFVQPESRWARQAKIRPRRDEVSDVSYTGAVNRPAELDDNGAESTFFPDKSLMSIRKWIRETGEYLDDSRFLKKEDRQEGVAPLDRKPTADSKRSEQGRVSREGDWENYEIGCFGFAVSVLLASLYYMLSSYDIL